MEAHVWDDESDCEMPSLRDAGSDEEGPLSDSGFDDAVPGPQTPPLAAGVENRGGAHSRSRSPRACMPAAPKAAPKLSDFDPDIEVALIESLSHWQPALLKYFEGIRARRISIGCCRQMTHEAIGFGSGSDSQIFRARRSHYY